MSASLRARVSVSVHSATYITATDPGVLDVDEHIVRVLQLGNRSIFILDLVDAFQDEGEVLMGHVSAVLNPCDE